MKFTAFAVALAAAGLAAPLAHAQDAPAPRGPETTRERPNIPAQTGERPVVPMGGGGRREGAVSTTGSTGILSLDQKPRFREFALREKRSSVRVQDDVKVGLELPREGMQLYDIPPEFNAGQYRYTILNERPVIVDPATRRIVEVIQ